MRTISVANWLTLRVLLVAAGVVGVPFGNSQAQNTVVSPERNLEFQMAPVLSNNVNAFIVLKPQPKQPERLRESGAGYPYVLVKYDAALHQDGRPKGRVYFGAPRAKDQGINFVTAASPIDGPLTFDLYVFLDESWSKEKIKATISDFITGQVQVEMHGLKSWQSSQLRFWDPRGKSFSTEQSRYVLPHSGKPVALVCLAKCPSVRMRSVFVDLAEADKPSSVVAQPSVVETRGAIDTPAKKDDALKKDDAPKRDDTLKKDAPRQTAADDPGSVKIRVMSFATGRSEPGFQVRAVPDCSTRSVGQAKWNVVNESADVPLPAKTGKQKETICFVVSRTRTATSESCFTRLREDVEPFARASVALEFPAELEGYRCPAQLPLAVKFIDVATNNEVSLADLRKFAGEIRLAGSVLQNATLSQYPADFVQSPTAAIIEFARPAWLSVETPSYRLAGGGAELRIPFRTNFVGTASLRMELLTSAGIFEPNCQPMLELPAGNVLNPPREGRSEYQVSTGTTTLRYNALQEQAVYEPEQQGAGRYVLTGAQAASTLRFMEGDRLCKVPNELRAVMPEELRAGKIVRVVRESGLVLVSMLTASNALKEMDPRTVEQSYAFALELLNSKLTSKLTIAKKKVERHYLIEWLRASRPDGAPFLERASAMQDAQLFPRPVEQTQFLKDFLYDRNALRNGARAPIITRESSTTPGDPAALDSVVEEHLKKQGFRNLTDYTVLLIGRTPADGGSVCSTWQSFAGAGDVQRRRLAIIEFATAKMVDQSISRQFQPIKGAENVMRCTGIPESAAGRLGIFLVRLPEAIEMQGERDSTMDNLSSLLAQLVGETR